MSKWLDDKKEYLDKHPHMRVRYEYEDIQYFNYHIFRKAFQGIHGISAVCINGDGIVRWDQINTDYTWVVCDLASIIALSYIVKNYKEENGIMVKKVI